MVLSRCGQAFPVHPQRYASYLALYTGMLDQRAGVRGESRDGAANVAVNFKNLFHTAGDDEGRRQALLHRQHHTVLALNTNGRRAQLSSVRQVPG